MENITLTDIVRNELNKVFSDAKKAYFVDDKFDETTNHARLDTFLVDETSRKEKLKEIKKVQSGLLRANNEYQQLTTESSLEFTLENINTIKKTFSILDKSFPEIETTNELSEFVFNHVDRTPFAKLYNVVKKFMWDSTAMALIGAGASYYAESYTALALYGTAAACSISSLISKKDSVLRSFVANAGIALGSTALSYTYPHKIDKTMDNMILGSSFIFQIPALVLMSKTVNYAIAKKHYRKKANHMKNTKPSFDNFLKGGVVLEEAHKHLGYIQRFCKSTQNDISNFKEEVGNLENALLSYYNGNSSLENIDAIGKEIKFRVKYLLSTKTLTITNGQIYASVSPRKFSGYSEEERAKEKKLLKGNQNETIDANIVIEMAFEDKENSELIVEFSEKLKSYDSSVRIGGYLAETLKDITQQKIIGGKKGEVIKNAQSGKYLVEELRREHTFHKNSTVYKMQPIGSLRSLYIRDGNMIRVLDIVTHIEYERMMNGRT